MSNLELYNWQKYLPEKRAESTHSDKQTLEDLITGRCAL